MYEFFQIAIGQRWAVASVMTLLLSSGNLLTGYERTIKPFNRNLSTYVSLAKDWFMPNLSTYIFKQKNNSCYIKSLFTKQNKRAALMKAVYLIVKKQIG